MKIIYISLLTTLLLFSCKNNKQQNNINIDNSSTSIQNISVEDSAINAQNNGLTEDSINNNINNFTAKTTSCFIFTEYGISSPADFKYQKTLLPNYQILFKISNKNNYETTYPKSIALGVYYADLVYVNVFENGNLLIDYYKIVLELSSELGITVFSDENNAELFSNPENFDTLAFIINKNIQNTCTKLYDSKSYDQLPFIIYGGWIESVYLLTNILIDNPEADEEYYKQLANQKEIIINLLEYYNTILLDAQSFEINNRVQSILTDLDMLKNTFTTNYKSSDYIMTNDDIKKINNDIVMIRNIITQEPQQKEIQQQEMLEMQKQL